MKVARRHGVTQAVLIIFVAVVMVTSAAGGWIFFFRQGPFVKSEPLATPVHAALDDAVSPRRFEVSIRKPAGAPRMETGQVDSQGNPITVSCSTCHATRQPDFENKSASDLTEFHKTLSVSHGTASCLSCHNSEDYDALKLADGTRIEFTEVMTLCAQCHGPQMTAYQHGAHGGLNGYWDLKRGPQVKNNCVDCHNPHLPQFPKMQPSFKPRDRFLEKDGHR